MVGLLSELKSDRMATRPAESITAKSLPNGFQTRCFSGTSDSTSRGSGSGSVSDQLPSAGSHRRFWRFRAVPLEDIEAILPHFDHAMLL